MTKYKIIATGPELNEIGIVYSITGMVGEFVKEYPTGYICLKVKHKYHGHEFENEFDIPKHLLEKV